MVDEKKKHEMQELSTAIFEDLDSMSELTDTEMGLTFGGTMTATLMTANFHLSTPPEIGQDAPFGLHTNEKEAAASHDLADSHIANDVVSQANAFENSNTHEIGLQDETVSNAHETILNPTSKISSAAAGDQLLEETTADTTSPPYSQTGGPFTQVQEEKILNSTTEMGYAASAANSDFAYLEHMATNGNLTFLRGVVSAIDAIQTNTENTFTTMSSGTPTQAECASFVSGLHLQAEIAEAGQQALEQVTAPIIAGVGEGASYQTVDNSEIVHLTKNILYSEGLSSARITSALNELDEGPTQLSAADQDEA